MCWCDFSSIAKFIFQRLGNQVCFYMHRPLLYWLIFWLNLNCYRRTSFFINSLLFSKFSSFPLEKKSLTHKHRYFCRVESNSFHSYLSISWITIKSLEWIESNRHAQSVPKNAMRSLQMLTRCTHSVSGVGSVKLSSAKQLFRFRKVVTVVSVFIVKIG